MRKTLMIDGEAIIRSADEAESVSWVDPAARMIPAFLSMKTRNHEEELWLKTIFLLRVFVFSWLHLKLSSGWRATPMAIFVFVVAFMSLRVAVIGVGISAATMRGFVDVAGGRARRGRRHEPGPG
jgi:hypothetical protein